MGIKNLLIKVSITNDSTKSATIPIKITFTCDVQSLSFTTTASTSVTVGITNQPLNIAFTVAQTPNCGQTLTFTLSPLTFVSLAGVTANSGSIQVNGATIQDHRATPYTFTLSANINSVTASTPVDVVVTDPCSTAIFSINVIPTINA